MLEQFHAFLVAQGLFDEGIKIRDEYVTFSCRDFEFSSGTGTVTNRRTGDAYQLSPQLNTIMAMLAQRPGFIFDPANTTPFHGRG